MLSRDEVLDEMAVNTPARKMSTAAMKQKRLGKDGVPALFELWLHQVALLVKEDGTRALDSVPLVHSAFTELYRSSKHLHCFANLKIVVKQHLTVIVKLLTVSPDLEPIEQAILWLFNETNTLKAKSLDDILLAEETLANVHYLTTLKILCLQTILKFKRAVSHQQTVVKLFACDNRYLDVKNKIHTIVKLLLNFFTVLPDYKVLFGLKYLQYVRQFKLDSSLYIKNMSLEQFFKQIVYYASKSDGKQWKKHFTRYFMSYTNYEEPSRQLRWDQLLPKDRDSYSFKQLIQQGAHLDICCLKQAEINTLIEQTAALFKNMQTTRHASILDILRHVWDILERETTANNKICLSFFDKTLLFVNTHIKDLKDSKDDVLLLLRPMSEYTTEKKELTRTSNIVNVAFNCSVILNDPAFLSFAAELELKRYNYIKTPTEIYQLIKKFGKFISNAHSPQLKLELFAQVFNINTLAGIDNFPELFKTCQALYVYCFCKLKISRTFVLADASEVMCSILYGCSNISGIPHSGWSNITYMLYLSIAGRCANDVPEGELQTSKTHFLYQEEVLIKSAYFLNLEIINHSCLNLSNICKMFLEKWVRIDDQERKISTFEIDFIKMLLQYLSFNNFDKLVLHFALQFQKSPRYNRIFADDISYWILLASEKLKIPYKRDVTEKKSINQLSNLQEMEIPELIAKLRSRLNYQVIECKDEAIRLSSLPKDIPKLFDINNKLKVQPSLYVKILLFDIEYYCTLSAIHWMWNDPIGSIVQAKRALNLSVSLLRKQDKISQRAKLQLISLLSSAYMNMINAHVRLGLGKDSEYYAKEFSKVICDLRDPTIVFNGLIFLYEYYMLTNQTILLQTVLKKANATFDYLDGENDLLSLSNFLFHNQELEKLANAISLFLKDDIASSLMLQYWKVKMGEPVPDEQCPIDCKHLNQLNKFNKIYHEATAELSLDPFFRDTMESVLAIPSCIKNNSAKPQWRIIQRESNDNMLTNLTGSPRSSNMTPRKESTKQKFDRGFVLKNLNILKKAIDSLDVTGLTTFEIRKVASLYSLTSSLLFNINEKSVRTPDFTFGLNLLDLPKRISLFAERKLIEESRKKLQEFEPLPLNLSHEGSDSFDSEYVKEVCEAAKNIHSKFNVITIDVCPVTGNLLLNIFSPYEACVKHLRLPLDRATTRDLADTDMCFNDMLQELRNIIKESDETTSLEVTSSISTKQERTDWWSKRYSLDNRLHELLSIIDRSWFNGLSGIFCQDIINENFFTDFKSRFYEILHENLPSRKQTGSPSDFIKLEDWIIKLFLQLDISSSNLFSMVEDLLFFVFDTLLCHGEENAYDEIDTTLMHVQIEDEMRNYHSRVPKMEKLCHTFLIAGSGCQMIPWESLPFLKDKSLSRVPNMEILAKLLEKHKSWSISIDSKVGMILNPHSDLKKTQDRFGSSFNAIKNTRPGSYLIEDEKPDESTYLQILTNANIFIYVGHGAGEQYIHLNEIKKQEKIAPCLLLGCSSAAMKSYGQLEPTGTLYAYLLGGSPMVLGNLWDVTDKDIDKFSIEIFDKTGFTLDNTQKSQLSVTEAVASSRSACNLKYLNGAAPVVYGLPLKFCSTKFT